MSELDQIEESIKSAKARVAKAEALERLTANADFRMLVADGYLKDNAVRLTHLYGSGSLQEDQRIASERDLHAIGSLNRYFYNIIRDGNQAESDIASAEYTKQELLAELASDDPELPFAKGQDTRNLGA